MKSQGVRHSELVRAGLAARPEKIARDRLRAAAPYMLKALKAALPVMIDDMKDGYVREDGADAHAISLIRAALAKAEGKP